MYIVEKKNEDGSKDVTYFYKNYEDCKRFFMHRVFVYLAQNQEVFSYGKQFTIEAFFFGLLRDCNLSNKDVEATYVKYRDNTKKLFIYLASYEENKNIELDKMKFEGQDAEGSQRVKIDINDVEFNIDFWDVDLDSHHFIHTNINDNSKKEYYFISNQEVICCEANSKYELGEKYNIDIRIRYIESSDDSIC